MTNASVPPNNARPPLRRSRSDRVLGGVAAGVARTFGLDVGLVRIIFVLMGLFAASGVLVYLVAWLVIPEEGSETTPPKVQGSDDQSVFRIILGAIVIVLGLVMVVPLTILLLPLLVLVGAIVLILRTGKRIWRFLIAAPILLIAIGLLFKANSSRWGSFGVGVALLVIGLGFYLGLFNLLERTSESDLKADYGSGDSDDYPYPAEVKSTASLKESAMTATVSGPVPDSTSALAPPSGPASPSASARSSALPSSAPISPGSRSNLGRITLAFTVIAIGVVAFLQSLGNITIEPQHYFAVTFLVIGVGLIVGAYFGRARGLIALGIIIAPIALISPFLSTSFDSTLVTVIAPHDADDVKDSYSVNAGTMLIDLTNLEGSTDPIEIDAHVGMGRLVIVVPDSLGADGSAQVDFGSIDIFGDRKTGTGGDQRLFEWSGVSGMLDLDLSVDLGRIEIVDSRPFDLRFARLRPSPVERSFAIDERIRISSPEDFSRSYNATFGSVTLDLSDLDAEDFVEPEFLEIKMMAGEVILILPDSFPVHLSASMTMGELILPTGKKSGLVISGAIEEADPLVVIDVRVGAGSIRVETS